MPLDNHGNQGPPQGVADVTPDEWWAEHDRWMAEFGHVSMDPWIHELMERSPKMAGWGRRCSTPSMFPLSIGLSLLNRPGGLRRLDHRGRLPTCVPIRISGREPNSPAQKRVQVMTYVDGFVAAVPTANREAYRKHAEAAAVVFKEHGALKLVECWGDDVPEGDVTSFPMAVKSKPDETVVFSWILWPSREVRDAGMKKVMDDPRLKPDVNPMPFDGKRLIYGGFEMIVDA